MKPNMCRGGPGQGPQYEMALFCVEADSNGMLLERGEELCPEIADPLASEAVQPAVAGCQSTNGRAQAYWVTSAIGLR
ncbi:hypothetical protein AB0942_10205 [Streptomyces nodosus]|uniref:hypothetical protein n=1 Tax=Streptomyces nodosus TaxID=40318 RepID=UPI0034524428